MLNHFLLFFSFFVNATAYANTPIELTFEIILEMERAGHNFPHKDEFETTKEYKIRVNAYTKNVLDPLTRPVYKISEVKLERSYDADNSKWTFFLLSSALETEQILISFLSNESRQMETKDDSKKDLVSIDIKLANDFPLKYSLPMKRDLAKAINENIRATYTFTVAVPPNGNKKGHFSLIQAGEYNTLFVELIELQLYSMDTPLAQYSRDDVIIHPVDNQLASEMKTKLIKQKQHIANEVKKYIGLITDKIYDNLITDKYTMAGKQCTLTISLAPSGAVNNVLAIKGNTGVCIASKKSILKAAIVPVPQNPDIFKEMTTVLLTITPEF